VDRALATGCSPLVYLVETCSKSCAGPKGRRARFLGHCGLSRFSTGYRDPMSTHATRRRLVLVSAGHDASGAAPGGVEKAAFARACLADCYEVAADLVEVASGIAGPPEVAELLWPGGWHLPGGLGVLELARKVADGVDELVVLTADAPDLPGLVLAKMFQVLHRVDLVIAPQRNGGGCVAIGIALPPRDWLTDDLLDLDRNPVAQLPSRKVGRGRWALAPAWHRLQRPDDLARLDAGLEGWEQTRALLAGPARSEL
jgi:hypothetical protein